MPSENSFAISFKINTKSRGPLNPMVLHDALAELFNHKFNFFLALEEFSENEITLQVQECPSFEGQGTLKICGTLAGAEIGMQRILKGDDFLSKSQRHGLSTLRTVVTHYRNLEGKFVEMKTGQRRDGAPSVNPPSPPGGNLVNPKTPDETKKPNEGDQINIENLPDLEPTISYVELLEVHFKKGVVIFSEERAKRTIKLDEEAKTGPLNITVPVKIFYSRDVKGQIQRSTTAGEVHKMFQLLADAWAEWIDKRK